MAKEHREPAATVEASAPPSLPLNDDEKSKISKAAALRSEARRLLEVAEIIEENATLSVKLRLATGKEN